MATTDTETADAFFTEIEAHFAHRRGTPFLFSADLGATAELQAVVFDDQAGQRGVAFGQHLRGGFAGHEQLNMAVLTEPREQP